MTIDDLKAVDLPAYMEKRGVRFFERADGHATAFCPFHEDHKPSLSLDVRKGTWLWKCFGCGIGGTIVDFVMKQDGTDNKSAVKSLVAEFNPSSAQKPEQRQPVRRVVAEYPYASEDGSLLYKILRFEPKAFAIDRKLAGVRRVLFGLPAVLASDTVWLVEGEKDALNVTALGLTATTSPLGKNSWRPEFTESLAGKSVFICLDTDAEAEARKRAADISKVAREVKIIRLPGLTGAPDSKDISDWLEQHDAQSAEDLRAELERIAAATPTFAANEPNSNPPTSILLSNVEPREVPWLWPNYLPIGRATLISGDPGSAKTWFCLNLAARLSRGLSWPDGTPGGQLGKTYYMTVEDDPHDTIRPRIETLGGDASQIAIFNSEHPIHLDLSTPDGLQRLESEISTIGDIRLVCIDPIIDFSGAVNPNAGEEVRALLTPLIRLASKLNFALILVGHLNKAQTLSAIYRSGGSTSGWLGKCRASFMIFRDLDDKALRHVIPIKANLAPVDPPQIEFRISGGRLDAQVSTEEVDPEEHLNPQRGPDAEKRDAAAEWLAAFFGAQAEVSANEIFSAAKSAGFSEKTLKRAKKAVGVESRKTIAGWVWLRPNGGQEGHVS
jgi:hypothetical protein